MGLTRAQLARLAAGLEARAEAKKACAVDFAAQINGRRHFHVTIKTHNALLKKENICDECLWFPTHRGFPTHKQVRFRNAVRAGVPCGQGCRAGRRCTESTDLPSRLCRSLRPRAYGLENVLRGTSDAPLPDTQVLMNIFLLSGLHAVPRAWVSLQEPHRDTFMRLKFRTRVWHAAAVCPRSPQSSHVAAAS